MANFTVGTGGKGVNAAPCLPVSVERRLNAAVRGTTLRATTPSPQPPDPDEEPAVPITRFNHMELSFPRGTLTTELRGEIDAFYGDVFGWTFLDTEVIGQLCHLCLVDEGQFILLAESSKPLSSPG